MPGTPKFLIVDDNPGYRRTLTAIVEGLGGEVRCAPSGGAALAACRREHFAGVLMDYQMPGANGLVTARALRALGGSEAMMPIVMISSDHGPELCQAAQIAGIDACLPKSARPAQIAQALLPAFARRAA